MVTADRKFLLLWQVHMEHILHVKYNYIFTVTGGS